MEVYTLQLAHPKAKKRSPAHELAIALQIPVIDTTRMTGHAWFAPDWDMVWGHKNGTLSNEKYTEQFEERMLRYFQEYRDEWEKTIAVPKFALACYCKPMEFCHRHLLVDIFRRICEKRRMEFHNRGEIAPVAPQRLPYVDNDD